MVIEAQTLHTVGTVPSLSIRSAFGATLAVLLGCTGSISDPNNGPNPYDWPDPDPEPPVVCEPGEIRPGRAPLRRLTVDELDRTLEVLLGDTSRPASGVVDDERGITSADGRIMNPLLAEQYMDVAERMGAVVQADPERFTGCTTADAACANEFIDRFAPRAFRHPLATTERDALRTLYTDLRAAELGHSEAIGALVESMLQSPHFLYRVELPPAGTEDIVRLDGYQLASRLSYYLWGTMPDDTLFEAAASGALDTDAGVEAQARRLLAHENGQRALQGFFHHFLELEQLDELSKDAETFPDWNDETAELFRQETEAFVHAVMVEGDGRWQTLLTAPWTMVNAELAAFYGIEAPAGEGFQRVELDPEHHAGLLTHGSLMATRARTYETSPIHRGMFVQAALLCGTVPRVPDGLLVEPPDPDPSLTTRERLAEHTNNMVCNDCHSRMDPLGFAFEHFDGSGRFRATENDLPIDATGEFVATDIEDPDFDGPVELATKLLDSPQSQACFVEHWFRYGYGRSEDHEDGCTTRSLTEEFVRDGFDVRELMVRLTTTDTFLHRVRDQDSVTPEREEEEEGAGE